jgi:Ca-activated chloride channel family protein
MKYDYGYIYDGDTSEKAVSKIDEESLKRLSEELDIEYLNMNSGNFGLAGVLELIRDQSGTVVETGIGAERYDDTYYYYAIALLVCLFIEAAFFIRKGRL